MTSKQKILEKWTNKIKESEANGQFLWKSQAQQNYSIISTNTTKKALELLKAEYEKYSDMMISSFIKEAIQDLEELE